MTLRGDLTEGDVYDIVRTTLGEEGWTPAGKAESETVLCVDIDEVATIIAQKLVTE